MPTHDESLDELLPEKHNSGHNWQGQFRRGHPDAVLLRYALEAAGRLSGLLISHLDVFHRGISLNWSERYSITPPWPRCVERLPLGGVNDLNHQLSLTHLLQNARPQYSVQPICAEPEFLDRVTEVTSLPVAFCSYGPTCAEVREK